MIKDSGGILFRRYFTNLKIENNQFINSCTDTAAIYTLSPFICTIRGNIMNGKQAGTSPFAGIVIDAAIPEPKHIMISDNIIYNFEKAGIVARDVKNLCIMNNHIQDCGNLTNNIYSCIKLEDFNDKNDGGIISGNVISSSQTNKPYAGIECDDSPSITTNFVIIGNQIKDIVSFPIYSNPCAAGMVIMRNLEYIPED